MIPEDERWLGFIELRNLTSHTYVETVVDRIYVELPETLDLFRQLLSRVREEMKTL